MSTICRAAIVGTGRIGSTYDDEITFRRDPEFYRGENRQWGLYTVLPISHAASYTTTPGVRLVAAANRSEAKLQTFGERWGVEALYTDFRRMLREEQPDIVSVCTRSPEKAEVTVAAAEAGVKAIIVEKAMATSMSEADAMIEACSRNGVLLAVNHPMRFSPSIRRTKEVIDGGALGRLCTVMAHRSYGMLHIGTHMFDMLRYWAGDVVEIQAHVPNYEPEQDIPAKGTLEFANGVSGFFDHTHSAYDGYEARGTDGYLTTSDLVGDGWLFRKAPLYEEGSRRRMPHRLVMEPVEGEPHSISATQRLLREVIESLTTGVPFVSTGRDGAAALELGLACYVSHLAGGPIRLPLSDRRFRVPNK